MWILEVPSNITYSHHMCSSTDEIKELKYVQTYIPLTHLSQIYMKLGFKHINILMKTHFYGNFLRHFLGTIQTFNLKK